MRGRVALANPSSDRLDLLGASGWGTPLRDECAWTPPEDGPVLRPPALRVPLLPLVENGVLEA